MLPLLLLPRLRLLAEILFLRRQLALYQEREAKPRRPDTWTKRTLIWLSRLFNWRDSLVIVKPATFVALEVPPSRPPYAAKEPPAPRPPNGKGKPHLGRAAHRW